jgi:CheY-like chemotaxis protein
VLIVEDDTDIRETMIELLLERGFGAIGAANGAEAIGVLERATTLPCVILLDLMMPVMDGVGFREAQIANPAWAGIPVVVMSAYGDVVSHARALGVEHVVKPIGIAALVGAVRRHCRDERLISALDADGETE